jgi:hypothetical protein
MTSGRVGARRILALDNSYSGVAGELAIAMALLRSGYRVAKPYWNNDVMDLLILWRDESGHSHSVIPVQVKSVQRGSSKNREVPIKGLMKKYVQRHPELCLAIYSPELDKVWFIPGAHNILKVHRAGVVRSKEGRGKDRTAFELLQPTDDVKIYVDLTDGNPAMEQWLVKPNEPPRMLNKLLRGLTSRLRNKPKHTATVNALLDLADESENELPDDPLES